MFSCRDCGQEVTENAEFCPFCGGPQTAPVEVAPEQQELALDIDADGKVSEVPSEETEVEQMDSADIEVMVTDGDAVASEDLEEVPAASPTGEPLGSAPDTAHVVTGETAPKRSSLKTLSEGTLLYNRYQIAKKIGGGGMGAVYLAFDQNLGGVERAVKEMVQSSIEEEQQTKAIDDFKRESTILSTLDHPAIPTIYDYFFDEGEGRFYLVMKYITGGDLAGRLRSAPAGKIEERQVTEWAIQVADVLAYLHGLPETIVYRDLKPSNIMLDGNTGRVMLIDFGIARSINHEEKGVTAVGTMGYAPPELFSGQVEPRSDIYSLGSTMFHLLTGADPQNNPLLIFDFQKNPRPRQINSQLSDQMERILMRSVEYNAESRFSSAEEMRQTLNAHLENLMRGNVTYGVSEAPAAVSLSSQLVFCGFCGQRIVASDMFCAFCGAKQPIAQQGVHAEIYPRTASTAKLIIDGTSELDMPVFTLEKNENLLGRRDPTANIFPEVDLSRFDPQTKISRRHARIWRDGGAFLVEDLGSSNGTVLIAGTSETVRLTPRMPHPLASGDRLRIGDTTLHFLMS
ncbi:MAG: protein kinase [Pyrinomonadaceae bacterium]